MTFPDPRPSIALAPTVPQPPHVLIVDDHHGVTRALSALLQRSGFAPTCFNSGRDAISFVEGGPAANPIAVVVLDIHMPDMSGLVVSQKLRELMGPAVPIVILSGDSSMETLNSLPHVGATHFFRKPIKADQLIAHLRELLAISSAA
jgi:CheY-like chemotaxis protein